MSELKKRYDAEAAVFKQVADRYAEFRVATAKAFVEEFTAAKAHADEQDRITTFRSEPAAGEVTGLTGWLPDRFNGKLPDPRYERPAVERYLRADYDLPDGGVIDLGLESRDADTADATAVLGRALDRCVEQACDRIGDAREIAARLHALCEAWFPDRYWFAEVWTPSGAIKRYQVIQPAVVGGFRR